MKTNLKKNAKLLPFLTSLKPNEPSASVKPLNHSIKSRDNFILFPTPPGLAPGLGLRGEGKSILTEESLNTDLVFC